MDFIGKLQSDAFSNYALPPDFVVDTHGWCDETNFMQIFKDAVRGVDFPLIFEVGTWKGRSACMMASHLTQGRIICIDTWLGAPEFWTWGLHDPTRGVSLQKRNGYPTVYETFLGNVKALGHDNIICPFPLSSIQAAEVLSFHTALRPDAIYIDASHEENAVRSDMEAYFPLLKKGGTLFGDDYVSWPGVKRAVDAFVRDHHGVELSVHGEVWSLKN